MTGPVTRFATIFRGKRSAPKGVPSRAGSRISSCISSSLFPAVAVLCLILLATLAVAQVAHLHPSQSDADHCQLCIAMHTVAPVATAAAIVIIVQLGASTPQAEPVVVARQRQIRLFIRPPPVSS